MTMAISWIGIVIMLAVVLFLLRKNRRALVLLGVGGLIGLTCLLAYKQMKALEKSRAIADQRATQLELRSADAVGLDSAGPDAAGERPSTGISGPHGTASVRPAWKPDDPVDWKADVYPSTESAARALGAQVAEELKRNLQHDEAEFKSVQVYGGVDPQVLSSAAAGVITRFPGWDVIVQATAPGPGLIADARRQGIAYLEVDIPSRFSKARVDRRIPAHSDRQEHGGTLRVAGQGLADGINRSVRYVEKLWVDDLATFISLEPGRQWIVGASYSPATSEGEARQQAIESAVGQVIALVRQRASRSPQPGPWSGASDNAMRSWLTDRLQSGELISDRWAQRFLRPYGEIWREEVLVEMTPELMGGLQSVGDGRRSAWRASWVRMIGSTVGLVLLIIVMYLLLNSVTKGYFAAMLRFGAVTAVVLAVIGAVVVMLIFA